MDLQDASFYLNNKLNLYGADEDKIDNIAEELIEIYDSLEDIPELILIRSKFIEIDIEDKAAVDKLIKTIIETLEIIEASSN